MNISAKDKDGNKQSRFKSAVSGENFLFIAFYTMVGAIYFMMAVAIILKMNGDPDDIGHNAGAFGKFSYGMAVASDIAAGVMVFGWVLMCIYRRELVIASYHAHPHTNIGIEALFLLTHICFIVSDRVFVAMLPDSIDFYKIMYPIMFTFVLLMALMVIYLVCKWTGKLCAGTPARTAPASS
ncbi:hypothetical protein H4R19_000294 [Coemansia spiralis]|nr:hypothetical protein H4R19_000294 [Coemansia spiralis]